MANEITVAGSLVVAPSGGRIRSVTSSGLVTMSGTKVIENEQLIGTSAEALALGEITAPGWCYAKNLDATNYITLRNGATGADVIQLKPNEPGQYFRWLSTAVPYAIANSGSCKLEYTIAEN